MYSNSVIEKALNVIDLTMDEVIIDKETISCGKSKWLLLDDNGADEHIKDFIKDSLWAFRADFISNLTGYDKD